MTAMTATAQHRVSRQECVDWLPEGRWEPRWRSQATLATVSITEPTSIWMRKLDHPESVPTQANLSTKFQMPPLLSDEVAKELTGQVTGSAILHPTASCLLNVRSK